MSPSPDSTSPESSSIQPSSLILDLDQHLHRQALLESIQFLESLSHLSIPEPAQSLCQQAILRLTHLALHCRTHSETRQAIRLLHRHAQTQLARALERQAAQRPPLSLM